jgi:hypothetical protein
LWNPLPNGLCSQRMDSVVNLFPVLFK